MQLEIMRLRVWHFFTLQLQYVDPLLPCQNAQLQRNQQVQAAVLAEAIHLRGVSSLDPLATTGPAIPTFDIRPDPPAYRSSQVELLKAQLGISGAPLQEQALISANFTGRYGTCILASSIAFPTASEFSEKYFSLKQFILHGGLSPSPIRRSPRHQPGFVQA